MTHRRQPLSSLEFEAIYSKVPRATVEVVIASAQGVVLALRHEQSWNGLWHIPGGTILYKESVSDAIHRIAREELGVTVEIGQLLGYIEYPSEEKERGFGWSIGLAFHCTLTSEVDSDRWQQEQIQFFQELPVKMVEEQRQLLRSILERSAFT